MFDAGGLNGDGFFDEEYGDGYEYGESYSYKSTIRPVTCRNCGHQNLKWIETPNGWRTAYSSGLLTGKLHACGGGF